MAERLKISELPRITDISGNEVVLTAHDGDNYGIEMSVLKAFFRDSYLVPFDEIDNSTPSTVNDGAPTEEEGAVIVTVYLASRKAFAERKTVEGYAPSYYTGFSSRGDYMADGVVRTDRVFFCIADKGLYAYNGTLNDILDTIRIHVMTEEEFENLTNPIEGAFYATYEE